MNVRAALAACALVACGSHPARSSAAPAACDVEGAFPSASPLADGDAGAADLSKLRPSENAFALGSVAPFGQHFALFFVREDYDVCWLRATDAEHDAEIESCFWGGLAMPPKHMPPLSADVAPLARGLLARAAARCGATTGAQGTIVLGAGEGLTRFVTVRETMTSDNGSLRVPEDARWLDLRLGDGKTLVTRAIAESRAVDGDEQKTLAQAVLAAARQR